MLMKALCLLSAIAFAEAGAEPVTLKLWPDGAPTAMKPKSEATAKLIQSYGGTNANRLSDVTEPTLTIFRPEKPNGASVIVAPGGGYMFLSYAHEGTQVCEWLNSLGVTAALLGPVGAVLLGGAGIFPSNGLPGGTCELVKMYLSPASRGKGLGGKLISLCLERAAQEGFRRVYIETMPELRRAMSVYERFGFKYLDGPMGNTGHFGCAIWMLKDLD